MEGIAYESLYLSARRIAGTHKCDCGRPISTKAVELNEFQDGMHLYNAKYPRSVGGLNVYAADRSGRPEPGFKWISYHIRNTAMMNIDERNAYIREHFGELKRIRDGYANILHRRFPTVPLCDLQGYGWLGVIYGLDRVEPESQTFEAFVRRYVYLFMLTGGLEMLGIHRDRSRHPAEPLALECYDPHELVRVMDSVQDVDLRSYGDYEAVLDRQEVEHLLNVVEGSIEAQVLLGLLRHQSVAVIAKRLGVTIRKVRKSIEQLIRISKREQRYVLFESVCRPEASSCAAEAG